MNTAQAESARGYKLSFVINTVAGALLLLLGITGAVLGIFLPIFRGSLTWEFFMPALVCLSIGFAHRMAYLNLTRGIDTVIETKTFRRTSTTRLLGLPLYDIYIPAPSEEFKSIDSATAKGILAVGLSAKGIVAIGVLARGIFTLGVGSFGVVSVGVGTVGLLLAGGVASCSLLVAVGVLAVAPYAYGVLAIGYVAAGVLAIGRKILFSVL